ncbi:ANKRD17 [Mytilus coruscus]|uniref:ANKRD17 n=1 Tax=Mytilus coruscus TaxID=42192 RepID=A0A6J8A5I8_MYTCO|nr:ANKRD17 [Mytilus coruscus]
MFINNRAAKHAFKCIKENSCVTITASSGVGKTATLRHVALQMADEEYDVLLVTKPGDIVKFNNPKAKLLFVIDDLCETFLLNRVTLNVGNLSWRISKSHLHVYRDKQFESLLVCKSCECNLLSENMCSIKTEKRSIAELYLKTKAPEITGYSDLYDCFPLLCKLYHDNPKLNVKKFFQNPFTVYEAEIDTLLKKGHYTKYCALALCVIFDNKLDDEILIDEVNEGTRIIIENTCEACRLDRTTPRLLLQNELSSLKDTFIRKDGNMYKIIHNKIFDFLAYFFGQKIIQCLIKNVDSSLIQERFLLESNDEMYQFITVKPPTYHQMYIQRMIDDWSKGKVYDVFSNINMKMPQFRRQFMFHLYTLDISHQRQLAHFCDQPKPRENILHYDVDDVLLKCCVMGDIPLVLWCCNLGVDVNNYIYFDESPLVKACEHGHTEIVKILLERGTDINRCDYDSESPLMKACEQGHT